jgi:YidC/Oxa1 family membrane protein insertase
MDRKTIFVVVACFVLLLIWGKLVNTIYPPKPIPPSATNTTASASTTLTNQAGPATSAPPAAAATTMAAISSPKALPAFSEEEQTTVLSNASARYTFTSHGGGLKTIELLQFPETVSRRSRNLPTNAVATLNTPEAAPVLSVLADESVHGDGVFALMQTNGAVVAEKSLTNGLRIVKEFRPDTNYLIHGIVRMQNTSTTPITLPPQEWVIGTATPMGPDDRGDVEGVMWYDGRRTEQRVRPWFDNKGFRLLGIQFSGDAPRSEFRAGQSNVVWAAAENQFFTLIAMPKTQAVQVVSRVLELSRPSSTNNPVPKGFQTALIYPGVTISPGQTFERQFSFYAGPKEYRTLSRIADGFQNNADLVMGYGGFMGFFAKILLLSMNGLHDLLRLPYGWATIVLTVIIKLLFWPLTAASTRSAKRMQALAPQMKALQEKYKDEPQKFSQKQWEFWKKNKVNPLSGCLPMLVQLPVFFGLYSMLRSAIELRGAHWLWVADLSKPDTLFVIPGLNFFPFSLLGSAEGLPINLLPIIYISTALWQSHLTPTSPGMDPAQQRMIRWMPLLFLAILYNFSSGLALYMTVNNLLTILQTKLTKTTAPAPATAAPVLTPLPKKKK